MRVRSQPPCRPHSDQLRFRITAIGSLQACVMPAFEDASPVVPRPPARAPRRSLARTRHPRANATFQIPVNLPADGAHGVNSLVKATTFGQRPVHAGPARNAWVGGSGRRPCASSDRLPR
jgi:hypothetical protein